MPYPHASTFPLAPRRIVDVAPADTDRYVYLREPVILVTEGRGRESYNNSRALMRRIFALPSRGDRLLQVRQGAYVLSDHSIGALMALVALENGQRFFIRASRRRRGPERAIFTRWNWEYLGEYLGWEWRKSA